MADLSRACAAITALGYAVGSREENLDTPGVQDRLISPSKNLRDAGFHRHFMADEAEDAFTLALAACNDLKQKGGKLDDVDAIVFATCIPSNANRGRTSDFERTGDVKYLMDYTGSHLQTALGLSRAAVFGVTQQACTGLLGSLRLAKLLVESDPSVKKVLCLTSDRFPAGSRYEQAYNLISDGAAAALVEAGGEGYAIRACRQLTNGAMAQASDDETVGHFFSYTSRLVKETLNQAEMTVSDIRWVVPQNTNSKAWLVLSRLLGFPFESVALRTLNTVGHMISGDNIVNLIALEEGREIQRGDRLLLLMAGYGLNWQSVVLERT